MAKTWTAKDVEEILLMAEGVASLNTPIDKDGQDLETELGDLLEDPDADVEVMALREAKYEYLHQLLVTILSERERYVIMRRFGFVSEDEKNTLEEIARELHLTRERVRQIQDKALRKLRLHFKRKKLLEDDI